MMWHASPATGHKDWPEIDPVIGDHLALSLLGRPQPGQAIKVDEP